MNQPTDIQRKTIPVYIGIVFFFLLAIIAPVHATTLQYDQMGNVIDIDGTKQYEYDTKGRLKSATDLETGNITRYQYDHNGNRVLTIGSNGTVHITPNKYFEIKNGKIIKNIYAGDQLIATIESDGLNQHTSYIHPDHLSGANVITDDNGNIIQTNDYYPFGDQRINDQPTDHNHTKTFTGYDYDQDTGLYYAGQRYYNPQIGRFMSEDPVSLRSPEQFLNDPQQLNMYAYARNNPLMYVDPLGLWNKKTGEIEKGDTLGAITSEVNKKYNTSYSVDTVAKLNQIENPDKIFAGKTVIPNESTPDISKDLRNDMHKNAADPKIQNPFYFKRKVEAQGDWDLKSAEDTVYCISSKCGGKHDFVFEGTRINSDAPGNIHYGYVGSATWYGLPGVLRIGAGYQQNKDNDTTTGDDPADTPYVNWGMQLYYSGY